MSYMFLAEYTRIAVVYDPDTLRGTIVDEYELYCGYRAAAAIEWAQDPRGILLDYKVPPKLSDRYDAITFAYYWTYEPQRPDRYRRRCLRCFEPRSNHGGMDEKCIWVPGCYTIKREP